jgi:ribosomal-protein-serine acetyltransferase
VYKIAEHMAQPPVSISKVTASDAETLFGLVQNNREYLGQWLFWVKKLNSIEDESRFIENALLKWDLGQCFVFTISFNGAIVGTISASDVQLTDKPCELGYWVDQNNQGKGIVSTAITLLEKEMEKFGRRNFILRVDRDNHRSASLANKLGYITDGNIVFDLDDEGNSLPTLLFMKNSGFLC